LVDPAFLKSSYFFSARLTHIFTFTEIGQQFLTAFFAWHWKKYITFCCLYFSRGIDDFESTYFEFLRVIWKEFVLS